MSKMLRNLLLAAGIVVSGQAAAQVTFYEHDGFSGHSFTVDRPIWNFADTGFNDLASSATSGAARGKSVPTPAFRAVASYCGQAIIRPCARRA